MSPSSSCQRLRPGNPHLCQDPPCPPGGLVWALPSPPTPLSLQSLSFLHWPPWASTFSMPFRCPSFNISRRVVEGNLGTNHFKVKANIPIVSKLHNLLCLGSHGKQMLSPRRAIHQRGMLCSTNALHNPASTLGRFGVPFSPMSALNLDRRSLFKRINLCRVGLSCRKLQHGLAMPPLLKCEESCRHR